MSKQSIVFGSFITLRQEILCQNFTEPINDVDLICAGACRLSPNHSSKKVSFVRVVEQLRIETRQGAIPLQSWDWNKIKSPVYSVMCPVMNDQNV